MDAQKELEKWKADFSVAKTPEEQAAHKKRFNAFFCSLFRQKTKKHLQQLFRLEPSYL